jgi:hypothetical protein
MKSAQILILICLLFGSCTSAKVNRRKYNPSSTSFKQAINLRVYKIDSINDYYLIYGRKNKSLFKIVSKKEANSECRNVHLNGNYKFLLTSIWYSQLSINGVNVSPSSMLEVNRLALDSSTYICLERDSINDLYHADNIKGLCLDEE